MKIAKVMFVTDLIKLERLKTVYNYENLYSFKIKDDIDLKEGDYAVVICSNTKSGNEAVKVVRVVEFEESFTNKATKEIIQKIDMDDFFENERNKEELKRIEFLLKEKEKSFQKEKLYQMMSETDEEAKDLLSRFKDLKNKIK